MARKATTPSASDTVISSVILKLSSRVALGRFFLKINVFGKEKTYGGSAGGHDDAPDGQSGQELGELPQEVIVVVTLLWSVTLYL